MADKTESQNVSVQGKTLEDMTLNEAEEFISSLREVVSRQYYLLSDLWGKKPTAKQEMQLKKLRKKLNVLRTQHNNLKAMLSRYGSSSHSNGSK